MANVNLFTEMERFREKLLDLSMRNPLLNYRKSTRRTLQIVDELPEVIFQRLVGDGRTFAFDAIPEPPEEAKPDEENTGGQSPAGNENAPATANGNDPSKLESAIQKEAEHTTGANQTSSETPAASPKLKRHELPEYPQEAANHPHLFDDKLQTNLTDKKLESVLRYMQREAKTAFQETGINYLHLALGFLSWRDSENSERDRLSPLVLIPIEIQKTSDARTGQAKFVIRWTEDDIASNLCLMKKLERDFGLELPTFDLESSPEAYFAEVLKRTARYPSWQVKREALIGFFSFHKLSMYSDIDPRRWDFETEGQESSLVGQIICGSESHITDTGLYANDYDIDNHELGDQILLPLDADSSQHSALCDIRAGRSLVIEGPPGTGKSQTIANAIADAIGAGKSVLFVAEKLTALQVVGHRLEDLGLRDFCLELHSDAASPRHVYEALRERLANEFKFPSQLEDAQEKIRRVKSKLNDFVTEMGQSVAPVNIPLYTALWRVIELRNAGAQFLREFEAPKFNREDFQDAMQLLDAFGKSLILHPNPRENPWWGFFPSALAAQKTAEITDQLNRIHSSAKDLKFIAEKLADELQATKEDVLIAAQGNTLDSLRKLQSRTPKCNTETLLKLNADKLRSEVTQFITQQEEVQNKIQNLELEHKVTYVTLSEAQAPLRELTDQFSSIETTPKEVQEILAKLGTVNSSASISTMLNLQLLITSSLQRCYGMIECEIDNLTASDLANHLAWATECVNTLGDLKEAASRCSRLTQENARNTAELDTQLRLHQLMLHPIVSSDNCVTHAQFTEKGRQDFKAAKTRSDELLKARSSAEQVFHLPSLPDAETLKDLVKTLRRKHSTWTRHFDPKYRKARSTLSEFSQLDNKQSMRAWIRDLDNLVAYVRDVESYNTDDALKQSLGSYFRGMETDWEQLKTVFDWSNTVHQLGLTADQTLHVLQNKQNVIPKHETAQYKSEVEKFRECFNSDNATKPSAVISSKTDRANFDVLQEKLEKFKAMIEEQISTLAQQARRLHELTNDHNLADVSLSKIKTLLNQTKDISSQENHLNTASDWPNLTESDLYKRVKETSEEIGPITNWADALKSTLNVYSQQAYSRVVAENPTEQLASIVSSAEAACTYQANLKSAMDFLKAMASIEDNWIDLTLDGVLSGSADKKASQVLAAASEIKDWALFSQALLACREKQLEDFCIAAVDGSIAPEQISASFQLTELGNQVERTFGASSLLNRISGANLDTWRLEFQKLDREIRTLNREQIACQAAQRDVPAGNGRGRVGEFTELALIRHETQKQKRHCRIRDLISRAGAATQALKPCFMMSPLSVSRFLPQGTVEFDLVIMDEASQIKPEDALGTILRAKQLVVVGDPKQLPPTSFFDRVGEEIEDDDSTQLDNTESILEAAMKVFQPFRRLRWHYRSQHESLIRFSNTRFYDDDLVVFPSSTDDNGLLGVSSVFVEGATCKSGENLREAEAVVDAIVDHALTRPEDSLGVGAFNKKQAELIFDLLEKRCEADAVARLAIDKLRKHEDELFVKNLENVQGDERDVIFICYTYGPDPASGKLFQRFGPINTEKGWRRLNVLVTRSKKAMVVFHSMQPSEILGGPDKSKGVNAYKDFLSFAMNGSLAESGMVEGRTPESDFEIAVARSVEAMGMEAVPQIGVAGFFIDLGVRRREGDTSFILGIECDGATYHSARSARDRDRLREEIIKSRGWKIHRIWSTDWFLNQEAEEEKLRKAIQSALK